MHAESLDSPGAPSDAEPKAAIAIATKEAVLRSAARREGDLFM